MARVQRRLLVTDLDNTLWDWVGAWYAAYSALIRDLSDESGVPQDILENEIRAIHQNRGTSEYSNLINEIPSIRDAAAPESPHIRYNEALHTFRSQRKAKTALYPHVRETLDKLRTNGVRIVAYTESQAYWSAWRIKATGLDGVIDTLYSAADHSLPHGMTAADLRTGHYASDSYGLKETEHHHTPYRVFKPSPTILRSILDDQGASAGDAVFIGSS